MARALPITLCCNFSNNFKTASFKQFQGCAHPTLRAWLLISQASTMWTHAGKALLRAAAIKTQCQRLLQAEQDTFTLEHPRNPYYGKATKVKKITNEQMHTRHTDIVNERMHTKHTDINSIASKRQTS